MLVYTDYEGNEIRLTYERLQHIRQRHARVFGIPDAVELTLAEPDFVEPSRHGSREYHRYFENSNRWVMVVVAFRVDDAFILTARTIVSR